MRSKKIMEFQPNLDELFAEVKEFTKSRKTLRNRK